MTDRHLPDPVRPLLERLLEEMRTEIGRLIADAADWRETAGKTSMKAAEQLTADALVNEQHAAQIERWADALAAAESQGWRDIATAPKDGTLLLLYRPKMLPYERIAIRRANDWCGVKCCPSAEPTHWIPLPSPPKEQP